MRDKAAVEILSHFMGKDEDTESSDTSLWYVKNGIICIYEVTASEYVFLMGCFLIFYILLMVTIAYYYLCKIKKMGIHLDYSSCTCIGFLPLDYLSVPGE